MNWRLAQLAAGEGIETVETAEAAGGGGVEVAAGPFVLRRSGAPGQELQVERAPAPPAPPASSGRTLLTLLLRSSSPSCFSSSSSSAL